MTLTDTGGAVLTLMLRYRKFKETNTGPNPNPDHNRYRTPSDYRTFGLSSSHLSYYVKLQQEEQANFEKNCYASNLFIVFVMTPLLIYCNTLSLSPFSMGIHFHLHTHRVSKRSIFVFVRTLSNFHQFQ